MSTYIVNKSINSEGRKLNFIEPGIHDNVVLISIEFKISPNNNFFLVFTFEKDGKKLTHTEYEPKDRNGSILEDKKLNQIIRLKHIATKYISEEEFDFEANDFESFCQTMLKKLKGKYEGKKMRIKVVFSNKNFTSLPRYVPFIESMDVSKEKSRLEISSIDKMVKDAPDKSTERPNPYKDFVPDEVEVFEETSTKEDDLPF
jgi:hypothetical protein